MSIAEARPVHYKGAGQNGLNFICWRLEFDMFLSNDQRSMPKTTSSLDKVTCWKCWNEIAALATRHARI